jgi:translation initiation factor 2B subunit (eIF-2B alpha/beta/delta family)
MERTMNEVDALRAHIRHLNYAVATTTCRKTVDVLRQMLRETEAKLCAIEAKHPNSKIMEICRLRS